MRRTSQLVPRRYLALSSGRVSRVPSWVGSQQCHGIATVAAHAEQPNTVPPIDRVSIEEHALKSSRYERLRNAPPFSSFLTDSFQRQHTYLRISITERCNLRCTYCMPEGGVPLSPEDDNLTTPEILLLSELFVSQGVNKIRLTGGEPTIRKDILSLMRGLGDLRSKGLKELALTTNGVALWRKLDAMAEAGLTGVNLSLDTLDPNLFQIITRRKGFDAVVKSMDKILELNKLGAGIKLKINCVVTRGVNDREILDFVELGREKNIEVRFIEYMPFDGNKWAKQKMFSYEEMLQVIRERYPDFHRLHDKSGETSKSWKVPEFVGKVGFITSMTENFCGTCNRLRITSDGNLKVCLFGNAEVSLRDLLRESSNGSPLDETAYEAMREIGDATHVDSHGVPTVMKDALHEQRLLNVIGQAVGRKKARHAGMDNLSAMPNRPMILIDDLQRSFSETIRKRSTIHHHVNALLGQGAQIPNVTPLALQRRQFSTTSAMRKVGKEAKGDSSASLPHLTKDSAAHMVSVGDKDVTSREAIACGRVVFSDRSVLQAIRQHSVKKGDVLSVARIAAIMGAKRTADIVPLCHPGLQITNIEVDVEAVEGLSADTAAKDSQTRAEVSPTTLEHAKKGFLESPIGEHGGVRICAKVVCHGKTGVEMEALTAVTAGALTILDMCKALDKQIRIEGVQMVYKSGGRSGTHLVKDWNSN